MNGGKLRWVCLALACLTTIVSLILSASSTFAQGCNDPGVCPDAVWGQNPTVDELSDTFDAASRGELGTGAPPLLDLYVGTAPGTTKPYVVPAVLLKAIAQVETRPDGWKQFNAGYGQYGYTVIGSDCDIGMMQVTAATADGDSQINKCDLASDWYYNLGAGARVLTRKWDGLYHGDYPGGAYRVGSSNPAIIEDWYYAIWAYNRFDEWNNPADDDRISPDRPIPPHPNYYDQYIYPYQEMVWGYAMNPPYDAGTPRWDAVQLTLPDRSRFTDDQMPPNNLPRPMPAHADPHGSTHIPALGNTTTSRITVQNVSNQYAAVNVTTYSTSGTPVRYEDRTLAPLASWTVDPLMLQYGYSSYTPVSAVVAASQDVAVVARNGGMPIAGTEVPWYYSYTGFGPATSPAPDPGYGRVRSSLWVPGVYKGNGRNSWLHIQNAGFGTAYVTIKFYDEGGVLRDTDGSYGISPYGSLTLDLSVDWELGTSFTGSANIFSTNNQPLAVVGRIRFSNNDEAAFAGFGANVTLNQGNNHLHWPALHYSDGLYSLARVQNHDTGQNIMAMYRQYDDCLYATFDQRYVGYLGIGEFQWTFSLYAAQVWPETYYTAKLVGISQTERFVYEAAPTQSATLLSYGPLAERSPDTQIFVQNTNATTNAKVKLYVLNPDSSVVQTLVDWICPRNLERFRLMYMNQVPAGFKGAIKVDSQDWGVSPVPRIITALQLNRAEPANGGAIAAYTASTR